MDDGLDELEELKFRTYDGFQFTLPTVLRK